MEYHVKFVHTIGRIPHIALMSRVDICYPTCCLSTKTVAPTLPYLQGIKTCAQYLASHPHKPIFYPSTSYDGSNVIRITWSGNKLKDYKTQNCLKCHQYADHDRVINKRRSV